MRFIPGTSLLVLPADIAERLNLRIAAKKSANGQWIVRCNTVPSLPDITFFLGGKSYSLKATDYILEVQSVCLSPFVSMDTSDMPDGSPICVIGECLCTAVQNSTCRDYLWISCAGDVFFRRFYTVFDFGRNAIGFAEAA